MSEATRKFSATDLADRVGGRLEGNGDVALRGINALDDATPDEITFITDARYARRWSASQAVAAVVTEGLVPDGHDPERRALIFVASAELATARILDLFRPEDELPDVGVHPAAWVDETAQIAPDARIGPHVSVGRRCLVEAEVVLHPGVRLYEDVTIGAGSVLHANTVVRARCRIGRKAILHQNVSIGADGFGYRPAGDGSGLVKVPHVGNVILEEDVEIGAGSCVDRAKFGTTLIGAGTKVDNLVQIAHNCRIGRNCVIAALTGLAGSVTVGDGVQMGGCVSVPDHVNIGSGAQLAGRTAPIGDVPAGEKWVGYPAAPKGQTLRQWSAIRKLPDLIKRIPGPAGARTADPD